MSFLDLRIFYVGSMPYVSLRYRDPLLPSSLMSLAEYHREVRFEDQTIVAPCLAQRKLSANSTLKIYREDISAN